MATNEAKSQSGKVAFVTGAANGIGRAAALAFARKGASVVVADVSDAQNQETARMIQDLGGRALAVACDVSRNADVQRALNSTVDRFGRLDFAFNNAGIEYKIQPAADVTEEEWNRIMDAPTPSRTRCCFSRHGDTAASPMTVAAMDARASPGAAMIWTRMSTILRSSLKRSTSRFGRTRKPPCRNQQLPSKEK
jgi:hypothetical protein